MTQSLTEPVVVDASLAVKWVFREPYSDEAAALLSECRRLDRRIMAPRLLAYEATRVCHKRVRSGEMSLGAATEALRAPLGLLPKLEADDALHFRAIGLAARLGMSTTYDAHYLALAEREECELWTADERLWNAVNRTLSYVRWIGEYQSSAV